MLDIDVLGDNRNDILGVAFAHKTMFAVLVHVHGPTKVKEFHMSVCLGEKRTSRDIFDLIDNNPDRKSDMYRNTCFLLPCSNTITALISIEVAS